MSVTGSAMAGVAVAFAVLSNGGNSAALGYVFAAGVIPQILLMISGGVLADRIGRRPVMLGADLLRFAAQAALAAALLAGHVPVWVFVVLQAAEGTGEAFFTPALTALTPQMAPRGQASDANSLIGLASYTARIGGPALAGILVAAVSPAVVIAIDAASFGASVLSLALLRMPPARAAAASPLRDLADGWAAFRTRPWLWLTTLQYTLFNLFTWAPYLLLGPVLARDYLGGARAWGLIVTALAAGSVGASLALVGRRPRRPLVVSTAGAFGYPLPCLLLALHAPLIPVAAAALAAGRLGGGRHLLDHHAAAGRAARAAGPGHRVLADRVVRAGRDRVRGDRAGRGGARGPAAAGLRRGVRAGQPGRPARPAGHPPGPPGAPAGMTKGDGPGPSPSPDALS